MKLCFVYFIIKMLNKPLQVQFHWRCLETNLVVSANAEWWETYEKNTSNVSLSLSFSSTSIFWEICLYGQKSERCLAHTHRCCIVVVVFANSGAQKRLRESSRLEKKKLFIRQVALQNHRLRGRERVRETRGREREWDGCPLVSTGLKSAQMSNEKSFFSNWIGWL